MTDPQVIPKKEDANSNAQSDTVKAVESIHDGFNLNSVAEGLRNMNPSAQVFDYGAITIMLYPGDIEPANHHKWLIRILKAMTNPKSTSAGAALHHLVNLALSLTAEGQKSVRESIRDWAQKLKTTGECLKTEASNDFVSIPAIPTAEESSDNSNDWADNIPASDVAIYTFGLLNTLSLLVKMSVETFSTYMNDKFVAIATSQGLTHFDSLKFQRSSLQAIKGYMVPGSVCACQSYLLLLHQIGDSHLFALGDATGAMRLCGFGLSLPWIYFQACALLGKDPHELLPMLATKNLQVSGRALAKYLVELAGIKERRVKYGYLMARMLGTNYFSNLGIRGNSQMIVLLRDILRAGGNYNLDQLDGFMVSPSWYEFSEVYATYLVSQSMSLTNMDPSLNSTEMIEAKTLYAQRTKENKEFVALVAPSSGTGARLSNKAPQSPVPSSPAKGVTGGQASASGGSGSSESGEEPKLSFSVDE